MFKKTLAVTITCILLLGLTTGWAMAVTKQTVNKPVKVIQTKKPVPKVYSFGAVWTTDKNRNMVNGNLFNSKSDVYINGGPKQKVIGLPAGEYNVKVTDPSGKVLLGAGKFTASASNQGPYQLSSITQFKDTPNSGGEYKVWVWSAKVSFSMKYCKTDNFKVRKPKPVLQNNLSVETFYDANLNGIFDSGEQAITNWKVKITGPSVLKDVYTPWSLKVDNGAYTATEYKPIQNWFNTTSTSFTKALANGQNVKFQFGHVLLGTSNARSQGYWKNVDATVFSATYLTALYDLNLVNPDNTAFNPTTGQQVKDWIADPTSTNNNNNNSGNNSVPYKLSVQLAVMKLNLISNKVNENTYIKDDVFKVSVKNLIDLANQSLVSGAAAPTGFSNLETYQRALQNALNNANTDNASVFVLPYSSTYPLTF